MSIGKVKHLYPGGNTALGFFSFYNDIIKQEEAEKLYIIKGGPGVGKSTYMKKIGDKLLQKGYNVEFLHCSSDNNSLDGVKIPDLKIAFIDGTAPHVVDPKSPGAVDEILNFGDFWNEKGIREHKEDIIKANTEIGSIFERAYKYLKAAYAIYQDSLVINNVALNKGEINQFIAKLTNEVFNGIDISDTEGKQRSLFVSAITPNGLCNYLDNVLTGYKVYEIMGGLGTSEEKIIEKIKTAALERGFFVEAYYCSLNPYKLEHILIPDLNVALTTSNKYHISNINKVSTINMQEFLNQKILENHKEDLDQNITEFDNMISIALKTINRAKALHDRLETYYIPNINFSKIDTFYENTITKLVNQY